METSVVDDIYIINSMTVIDELLDRIVDEANIESKYDIIKTVKFLLQEITNTIEPTSINKNIIKTRRKRLNNITRKLGQFKKCNMCEQYFTKRERRVKLDCLHKYHTTCFEILNNECIECKSRTEKEIVEKEEKEKKRGEEEEREEEERNSREECSICLEYINESRNEERDRRRDKYAHWKVRSEQRCGHVFHKKCINKWIRVNRNCPMCRCIL